MKSRSASRDDRAERGRPAGAGPAACAAHRCRPGGPADQRLRARLLRLADRVRHRGRGAGRDRARRGGPPRGARHGRPDRRGHAGVLRRRQDRAGVLPDRRGGSGDVRRGRCTTRWATSPSFILPLAAVCVSVGAAGPLVDRPGGGPGPGHGAGPEPAPAASASPSASTWCWARGGCWSPRCGCGAATPSPPSSRCAAPPRPGAGPGAPAGSRHRRAAPGGPGRSPREPQNSTSTSSSSASASTTSPVQDPPVGLDAADRVGRPLQGQLVRLPGGVQERVLGVLADQERQRRVRLRDHRVEPQRARRSRRASRAASVERGPAVRGVHVRHADPAQRARRGLHRRPAPPRPGRRCRPAAARRCCRRTAAARAPSRPEPTTISLARAAPRPGRAGRARPTTRRPIRYSTSPSTPASTARAPSSTASAARCRSATHSASTRPGADRGRRRVHDRHDQRRARAICGRPPAEQQRVRAGLAAVDPDDRPVRPRGVTHSARRRRARPGSRPVVGAPCGVRAAAGSCGSRTAT